MSLTNDEMNRLVRTCRNYNFNIKKNYYDDIENILPDRLTDEEKCIELEANRKYENFREDSSDAITCMMCIAMILVLIKFTSK